MVPDRWESALGEAIEVRRSTQTFRQRQPLTVLDPAHVEIDGRRFVNFASNNYLGLTHHPRVTAAAADALTRNGVGSGAASLITGYTEHHATAERTIAAWKGTEAAVLLGSGYAANQAAIGALSAVGKGRGVRFLVDKLAHASLVDAVRAAAGNGASFRVFPHNHMPKLRRLLTEAEPRQLQVVVTESIFSMDGDAADLAGIVGLKREFPFLLLLDEAHAAGVYGPGGAGYAAELGFSDAIDLSIVTLSKALGGVGGAICGSTTLCDAVVNFGRAYVFSTSLPAMMAAAATAAIGVLADEPWRAQRVRDLARQLRAQLTAAGHTLLPGDSPIGPILLGDAAATLAAAERLRECGMLVAAVRPPTVPRGGSRLRITLSCEHTDAEVAALAVAMPTR